MKTKLTTARSEPARRGNPQLKGSAVFEPPRRIVAPSDFSEPSQQAMKYAVTLGQKWSSRISLIHIEPSAWPADVDTLPLILKRQNYIEAAQAWLEKFRDRAVPEALRGNVAVETGTPYNEIARYARETAADLIIVATHGYTGLTHALLGSTAEHLVRHAPCPVLTVRPKPGRRSAKPGFRKILAPTDFSDASRRSLQLAANWATSLGAEIVLLHVLELPTYPQYGYVRIPTEERKRKALAIRQLAELKEELGPELVTATHVRVGIPYHEIAAEAKTRGSDLIVVSTHGYTGLKHLLLGSTAERVVRTAPCPVLVTRET